MTFDDLIPKKANIDPIDKKDISHLRGSDDSVIYIEPRRWTNALAPEILKTPVPLTDDLKHKLALRLLESMNNQDSIDWAHSCEVPYVRDGDYSEISNYIKDFIKSVFVAMGFEDEYEA